MSVPPITFPRVKALLLFLLFLFVYNSNTLTPGVYSTTQTSRGRYVSPAVVAAAAAFWARPSIIGNAHAFDGLINFTLKSVKLRLNVYLV